MASMLAIWGLRGAHTVGTRALGLGRCGQQRGFRLALSPLLSCPPSLYRADNPDQQARADEARNEVADPSP